MCELSLQGPFCPELADSKIAIPAQFYQQLALNNLSAQLQYDLKGYSQNIN